MPLNFVEITGKPYMVLREILQTEEGKIVFLKCPRSESWGLVGVTKCCLSFDQGV